MSYYFVITGKAATELVQDTDKELALTLERTESHQATMVILAIGLAIGLLLLDFITP